MQLRFNQSALTKYFEVDDANALLRAQDLLIAKNQSHHNSLPIEASLGLFCELPDTQPTTLKAYLQSYLLLHDWLHDNERPSSHRISHDDFSDEFIDLVMSPDYHPDEISFQKDYLAFNRSPGKSFDLSSALADRHSGMAGYCISLTEPATAGGLEDLIKKWSDLEELAAQPLLRARMLADYLETREEYSLTPRKSWIEKSQEWLHPKLPN